MKSLRKPGTKQVPSLAINHNVERGGRDGAV
jgi:hypothetical protein